MIQSIHINQRPIQNHSKFLAFLRPFLFGGQQANDNILTIVHSFDPTLPSTSECLHSGLIPVCTSRYLLLIQLLTSHLATVLFQAQNLRVFASQHQIRKSLNLIEVYYFYVHYRENVGFIQTGQILCINWSYNTEN